MQFKIDESLPTEVAVVLGANGHDALTVRDQVLQGKPDELIAQVCRDEARILVTLDLDFSDIRAYPPKDHAGIIVLRLSDQSRTSVLAVIDRLVPLLAVETVAGRLWIVDENQVRVR